MKHEMANWDHSLGLACCFTHQHFSCVQDQVPWKDMTPVRSHADR